MHTTPAIRIHRTRRRIVTSCSAQTHDMADPLVNGGSDDHVRASSLPDSGLVMAHERTFGNQPCGMIRLMGSPPDKARRKQLRDQYKNAERAARSALLPLDYGQLTALVEFVDARVVVEGCDHTTRHGEQWARENGLEWDHLSRV